MNFIHFPELTFNERHTSETNRLQMAPYMAQVCGVLEKERSQT